MIVNVAKKDFLFLKSIDERIVQGLNFTEIGSNISINFENQSELDDWDDNFTFAIVHYGLDNQDEVNEAGNQMYRIYDSIFST